ncbi:hypothetical protein D3C81_1062550 [compost metagenome]
MLAGENADRCDLLMGFQLRIVRHIQGSSGQAGALDAIVLGVPPDHLDRRQVNLAGAVGHQRLALFTTADHGLVGVLVVQLRQVGVVAQFFGERLRQGRQLRAGESFDAQHDIARQ